MPVLAVLVRTHNPGNLGAAARAAKNFGAELLLVDPRAEVLHPDAVAFASGAEDLLRKVKTLATLDGLLHSAGDPGRPMLVGHDPDFSTLASELAGVANLPIRKAAIIRIDVVRPLRAGQGTIRWLVTPDLLGSDG